MDRNEFDRLMNISFAQGVRRGLLIALGTHQKLESGSESSLVDLEKLLGGKPKTFDDNIEQFLRSVDIDIAMHQLPGDIPQA